MSKPTQRESLWRHENQKVSLPTQKQLPYLKPTERFREKILANIFWALDDGDPRQPMSSLSRAEEKAAWA